MPSWETLFLNLHRTPPDALTRFATAVGFALRVLQSEQAPKAEFEAALRNAFPRGFALDSVGTEYTWDAPS